MSGVYSRLMFGVSGDWGDEYEKWVRSLHSQNLHSKGGERKQDKTKQGISQIVCAKCCVRNE